MKDPADKHESPLHPKWGKETGLSNPSVHSQKQTFFSPLNGSSFLIYSKRSMLGQFDKDSLCSGVLELTFNDYCFPTFFSFFFFFGPQINYFWNVVTLLW